MLARRLPGWHDGAGFITLACCGIVFTQGFVILLAKPPWAPAAYQPKEADCFHCLPIRFLPAPDWPIDRPMSLKLGIDRADLGPDVDQQPRPEGVSNEWVSPLGWSSVRVSRAAGTDNGGL
jgi:hypothetical protein